MKQLPTLILVLLLLCGALSACSKPASQDALPPQKTGQETVTQTQRTTGALQERTLTFADGTTVTTGQLSTGAAVVYTDTVPKDTTIRCYQDGEWTTAPLSAGEWRGTCIFLDAAGVYRWIYVPQEYEQIENECLRYQPEKDGYLAVTATADGFALALHAMAPAENCVTDYMVTSSGTRFFPWEDASDPATFLQKFANAEGGRWCFDAYYFPAPSTYLPSGEGVLYRNTAAYTTAHFSKKMDDYPGCYYLTIAMLHLLADLYNDAGYIPQENESTWLSGDYGIGSGYYDTRWNSDLIETYLLAYRKTQDPCFLQVMERHMTFYASYAAAHHWETENGGWLVEDYWHPSGGSRTHTSLNHHLAELSIVYQVGDLLEREDLQALGDRMLLGIEDTGLSWVREDHNLHYRFDPDGTFCGNDYPDLTYNDLYRMQQLLEARTGARNPTLQKLMDEKKLWMDANGVDTYLGAEA